LCRLTTARAGIAETADETTDPRPRVTNNTGNAQQTSVVIDDASPVSALSRSREINVNS
jgi:hypothetical protein